jgi:hypothetical protein
VVTSGSKEDQTAEVEGALKAGPPLEKGGSWATEDTGVAGIKSVIRGQGDRGSIPITKIAPEPLSHGLGGRNPWNTQRIK